MMRFTAFVRSYLQNEKLQQKYDVTNTGAYRDGNGTVGHGSWVIFRWVTWVTGQCQWPIDPWWWNNRAVACIILFLFDIQKLLIHLISPIIISGGLILIYNVFALKTERVVHYHHATPPLNPMRRIKWCNDHGSKWVTKDDPFPSLGASHTALQHWNTTNIIIVIIIRIRIVRIVSSNSRISRISSRSTGIPIGRISLSERPILKELLGCMT